MDVIEAIKNRREITKFKSKPLPQEQLDLLTQALYLSPTGNNLPSREFILVTDSEKLETLTPATPFMKWLKDAAAAYVIIGNPSESKYWLQDASIAAGYLWLAATSIGIGAAFGAIYHSEDAEESFKREEFVRKELNITEEYRVVAVIGLGYPDQEPKSKDRYPLERVYHQETFR